MKHRHLFVRLAVVIGLAFSALSPVVADQPQVNGRVEQIGPFRVVRVWGSPKEMGYAHGYLLGREYVTAVLDRFAQAPFNEAAMYEQVCASVNDLVDLPEAAREEIEGLFEGIKAANGGVPRVAAFNRDLRIDDLIVHNAGDLLRAFGCSGFTLWGNRAGDEGVITARNFDYPIDEKALASQFILVRQPKGRQRVATVTFPAYIGAFTGINEDGVCAFMHDGTGNGIRPPTGRYTPAALVLAEMLETTSGIDAHTRTGTMLKKVTPYPFSYLIRIVTPRVQGRVTVPALVFRIDADGLSENPVGESGCITTNHYLSGDRTPSERANEWSLTRYKELEGRISGDVTGQAAWQALDAVASDNPGHPTLHALVVYPERRRLDLAFASWDSGAAVPATRHSPTTIDFKELFALDR